MSGENVSRQEAEIESIAADYGALIGIEANLEVPPVFQMRRADAERRFAECQTVVVTEKGERLEQYWRISVPEPYTLPGSFDQDVWVAVQALVNRRGGMPPDGKLYFSMYELLEIMGKNHRGRHYDLLKESLQRLASTNFHSDNAFYLKDIEDYDTITFTPWAVRFRKTIQRKSGKETEKHELEFHSLVRRSFQADYLKVLDSDFFYSLRSPLAKRLYRLIDRKRQGQHSWGASLDHLKELAPLADSYRYPSKIKDVLRPAHKELMERGFLSDVVYESKSSGENVRYRVSREFDRYRGIGSSESEQLSLNERHAVQQLTGSGVWPNVAPDLVRRWGPETCARYVEALPTMKGVVDPGAWLRWAIETEYELPNHLQRQPRLVEEEDESGGEGSTEATDISKSFGSTPQMPEASAEASRCFEKALSSLGLSETPSVRVWFDSCVPVSVSDEQLTLVVPNPFAREYIEDRFKNRVCEALRDLLGSDTTLRVVDNASYYRHG